jgi:NADPH-dependent 2,4-dienoyl-CoA reductase/sulfur reductase-like enzyme
LSASERARRLDEHADIVVLEQGASVSFVNGGLPYHLSGEIAPTDALLRHTPTSLAACLNLDRSTGQRSPTQTPRQRKLTIAAEDDLALPYH